MDGQLEDVQTSSVRQDPALIAADTLGSPPGDMDSGSPPDANGQPIDQAEETKDNKLQEISEQHENIGHSPNTETQEETRSLQQEQESIAVPPTTYKDPAQEEADDETPPETPAKPTTSSNASHPSLPPLPPHIASRSPNGVHGSRPQSPALSVASGPTSNMHKRSMTTSKGSHMSVVLISAAMETIAASKEARRSAPLRDGIQKALELVKTNEAIDKPREILEPLRLACETRNEKLIIASLDCISKLVSYSFFAEEHDEWSQNGFSPPPSPNPSSRRSSLKGSKAPIPEPSLVDLVAHTIASCQNENTSDTVSVQIVKALLGLVLSQTTIVHHHSLLQSVRTVYNVYLTSNSPQIQMLAQGSLTQMVDHIFNRCKVEAPSDASNTTPSHRSVESLSSTLSSIRPESDLPPLPEPIEDAQSISFPNATPVTPSIQLPAEGNPETSTGRSSTEELSIVEAANHNGSDENSEHEQVLEVPSHPGEFVRQLTLRDLYLKDAFLILRALCKLAMKPVPPESEQDPKAHAHRSKVMALQLVLHVLNSHMALIVDPKSSVYSSSSPEAPTFVQQITQHLCLALSRNAVSPIPQVFELSVEIFWRVLFGMRTKLKKEIEVLLHEIFIPILEMKTSTLKQKAVIFGMFSRLCQDPQALVEIYLNYDCDSEASADIYEQIMNLIAKFGTSSGSAHHGKVVPEPASPALSPSGKKEVHASNSLNGGVLAVTGNMDTSNMGLSEGQLKRQALECLVSVLRSLVVWGTPPTGKVTDEQAPPSSARSHTGEDSRRDARPSTDRLTIGSSEALRTSTPEPGDDPTRFETAKQRKTTLLEGIKKFNFKPKQGIQFLLDHGFIPDRSPETIAKFLLEIDGVDKKMLGEYLGEPAEENVAVMHAFIDMMDFTEMEFVDAIRHFLQPFRLPGESQKVDRFFLKFAQRYMDCNTKTPFANADAPYILGFSIMMLNTDAHTPSVKKKMTKQEFIKMNRGINDGSDIPEELLSHVYDEILANEIVLKDEIEAKMLLSQSKAGGFASVGRDLQKEAYITQTSGMSNKTETLLTMMRRNSKQNDQFFSASHFVHVRPMFEVAWMSFLAGLSGPLQETDDLEVVELCLEGFRHAIHIVCSFDLDLPRNAFVSTLAKFTFLNNLGEMKVKNMEAIKTLLDVAVHEGNNIKTSWKDILNCVSQLEHMQLIGSVADVDAKGKLKKLPNEELANQSRSTHITVAADMVFSLSHYLSGAAIVDFVRALCAVSWEEIQSSGKSRHPRLFSLQKLVDISYYNMNRIRIEWSNIWEILGEHFNQVCCHSNENVAYFALDALRQLAVRFLDKEELPHFKFQKDFLKPFEYAMTHNQSLGVREMVLQCLNQMILAKAQNLRSGWRTMFGVFSAATKAVEPEARIPIAAFDIVRAVNSQHFSAIVKHGAFADLAVCITDFCKIPSRYQKISLSAMVMLKNMIPTMLRHPECGLAVPENVEAPMNDNMIKFWFPVLFAFYDIIMNGDDLEVRRLALEALFNTLKNYGAAFPAEFWDNTVCPELLFPIFAVLKNKNDLSRFHTQEDMSVWMQSTMFQALRLLVDLYTFHFSILERQLDGLMDLISICICQENKTCSQIGTSCLQQFLESNVTRLGPARWEKVTATFIRLFRTTTPHQLFDESLRAESVLNHPSDSRDTIPDHDGSMVVPAPLSPNHERTEHDKPMTAQEREQVFSQIIVKCILQLLLIEMTSDLLKNSDFYGTIPPDQLLKLMSILSHSHQFARMFNEDKQLRTELWRVGFMKHLPNLLKQESTSAATLVHVLLQMYFDERPDYQTVRPQVAERLLQLGLGVLGDYHNLRPESQAKNILAWNPVVAEILDGFGRLDDKAFARYLPAIYPLAVELLTRDIPIEIRQPLKVYFARVGKAQGILDIAT